MVDKLGAFGRNIRKLINFSRNPSLLRERIDVVNRLNRIENVLNRMEYFSNGSRATYLGNNRVLLKIVVEGRHLAFYVEADDKLLSPWFIVTGFYETDLTNYFVRELSENSRCIDVGANFGYFSCLMARFAPRGKVIGIEVDEKIAEIARDNLVINGFENYATIIHAAASNSDAEMTLHRRITRSGNTSIVQYGDDFFQAQREVSSEAFTVTGIRLDDLLPRMEGQVDFIKIDVEGAEPLVFEGAHEVIAANPNLKIVMEWSPGQIRSAGFDLAAFVGQLEAMGLKFYDIGPQALAPMSASELLNAPFRPGVVLTKA